MPREDQAATQLVRDAQRGDRLAYGELVRRYRPRIVALAFHLSGSNLDAEDIAQDVFVRAYQKLHTFEGRSHFFTWIYRMAVNQALNVNRSRARRREHPDGDERAQLAVAVDAAGDPERAASLREVYSRLLRALDALPSAMRTSVVLVTLQGLSHDEAAVVQRCAPGTIAWRIHEARRRLHRALSPEATRRRASEEKLSGDLIRLLTDWALPIAAPAR